jgi:DNA repair protein RadD
LHDDDIMGLAPSGMPVTSWRWRKHTSKTSGKDMLEVTYYGGLYDLGVKEYLTVTHEGYAGEKAVATLGIIASNAGVALKPSMTLDGVAAILSGGKPPSGITYKRDGKYHRIIGRLWG